MKTLFYEEGQTPPHAIFLTSGFASQVVMLPGTKGIEVGVIGREGLIDNLALFGSGLSSNRCFMQSDGAGYRIPLSELNVLFHDLEDVRDGILAYSQAHTVASAYLAACNKLHGTESRLARWLLMVQDRLDTDLLPLTQEFLAQMLGTRRMTVATAAGALQRDGCIRYKNGRVHILSREALKAVACSCYDSVRAAYSRLYVS